MPFSRSRNLWTWLIMPIFLDIHHTTKTPHKDFELKSDLKVRIVQTIRARGGRETYCILDAPDKETILQYHVKNGLRCDWVEEVTSLQSYEK